jgi:hypothetical protein
MTRKAQSDWDCSRSSERTLPEPARIVQEQLLNTTARGIVFHRLFSKVRREVRLDVRTGYQDETGFHSGVKPAENEIKWPPVW